MREDWWRLGKPCVNTSGDGHTIPCSPGNLDLHTRSCVMTVGVRVGVGRRVEVGMGVVDRSKDT